MSKEKDDGNKPVLGIDLGTTYSAIARWDGRGPRVYETRMGDQELQSAVYYDPKKDTFLVGRLAFSSGIVNPDNLAFGFKRQMDDGHQKIRVGGRDFTPIELSAKVLNFLYQGVADRYPPGVFNPRGTVVSVPYYFKAHQCENTRLAAEMAGIACLGIIQEPIAASLSYAWKLVQENPTAELEEDVLVFDLGGGTFDLTLFRFQQTKKKLTFEVLATGGDDRLGGMDFDERLAELILAKADLSLDGLSEVERRKARQKLLPQVIDAKISLSHATEWTVIVPYIIGDKNIEVQVDRNEFESVIEPYAEKIKSIIDRILTIGHKRPSDISRVIPVGGSSRIPRMTRLLVEMLGADKVFRDSENPSLEVVKGAAMYAAHLDDPEILGREIEIKTRTCHALGVEVADGKFEQVIAANKPAPCDGVQYFGTAFDSQSGLDINVYQGPNRDIKGNSFIGTVKVRELPPYAKGELDILVRFEISREQNLNVTVTVLDAKGNKLIENVGAFSYT